MNTPPLNLSLSDSNCNAVEESRPTLPLRRALLLLGACGAMAFMVGCSSSGSGSGYHGETRFAYADEDDFATTVETMEEGEELRLSFAQRGFEVRGEERSASVSDQGGVFTLRMDEAGKAITIEAPSGTYTWDAGTAIAGQGRLTAFDISGEKGLTELNLDSRYYAYVHFGLWEVTTYSEQLEHEWTNGGVFRQGFETDPANMPTSGGASYQGESIAQVFHAGQAGTTLHGTFSLHADFTNLQVYGQIDNLGEFNNVNLELGGIHDGNRFSGEAVAAGWIGPGAFTEGATGHYEGAFYGPTAEEAGGTWRLQEGSSIAVGAFGGGRGGE